MRTVAIIGAGPSGIVSAKSARECGLEPTVFEASGESGGLWRSKRGSVWESMRTNISYHTCSFSDFGWPEGTSDFPNQREVHRYLQDYANHFRVPIQYHSTVEKVARVGNQWLVHIRGESDPRPFDCVIVSSGIFSKPFVPLVPGMENFKGTMLHSIGYKRPDPFRGKKVVLVGNAFSGCEIASDLASTAEKVTHLLRRPMWILPRYLFGKTPLDLVFYSRNAAARSEGVAEGALNLRKNGWFKELTKQGEKCPALALDATEEPCFVAISDGYMEHVQRGNIEICKGSIDHLEENGLFLKDGSFVSADVICFCTGFQMDLPFFDTKILETLEFDPEDQLQPILLHKTVFPQNLPHLAFVGTYRGPYFGGIELQARWAAMVFSDKIAPPSKEEIARGIEEERAIRKKEPRPQFPHGNYVQFCDDLARQIGALPNFEEMREKSPSLYKKLWEGPFTPASYRLTGFGAKPEVALGLIERIDQAYRPKGS